MKTYKHIFEELLKEENITQCFHDAAKRKTTRPEVARVLKEEREVGNDRPEPQCLQEHVKALQKMLEEEMISTGHARALLAITNKDQQYEIAQKVFDEKLSVRDIEKLVKDLKKIKKNKKEEKDVHDILYTQLEESMKQVLGSKVTIKNKKNNKGKIEIEYYSQDELERIVDMIRSI